MIRFILGSLLLVGPLTAFAQDDDDNLVETVTSSRHTPLLLPDDWENPATGASVAEFKDLEFEPEAYRGAEMLGLNPEYVHDVRAGLDLIYLRDYKGARKHFEQVDEKFPGTGIAAVMQAVIWQALMLENFDYRYEEQYFVATDRAKKELTAALAVPGNEGWEHFLMAGTLGLEAIHTMRREKYLSALQTAFDAMDEASKSREAAPTFVDLYLADGIYAYWRTVVTMNTPILPDFGDHREEGILQMRQVETEAVFLGPPATLALAFTYIEEHDMKLALGACVRNKRSYPDNVINNLVLGQVQLYMHSYTDAMESWDRILAVAPDNQRVHYWKGVTLTKMGDKEGAATELETYLGYTGLEPYQESYAHYRLGQLYFRMKRYADAQTQYKAAVKIDGNKPAKTALDRMDKMKKDGKIDY